VDILGSIKIWGTTSTDTIVAKNLDGTVFQKLIGNKVEEIVRGEIIDGTAIRKFNLRACRSSNQALVSIETIETIPEHENKPNNYWTLLILSLFNLRKTWYKWFGSPILNKFVDLLFVFNQLSCNNMESLFIFRKRGDTFAYIFSELNSPLLSSRISRSQEVPNCEEKQTKLNNTANRIVLVRAFDVA